MVRCHQPCLRRRSGASATASTNAVTRPPSSQAPDQRANVFGAVVGGAAGAQLGGCRPVIGVHAAQLRYSA